jgi:hypothetical protein
MRKRSYRDHVIEFTSAQVQSGEWVASATIVLIERRKEKRIPIFGRRRATFETRRKADLYAMELAKLWIDGRFGGANGHG